ncbi:serine-threonine protein kinase [Streptomyces globosus]|uniref:serine-threonine protein kinase n=1 Tax=Streptomyces globosus TaxID=68209 RepID=UPI001FE80A84|nr:serine-threonine protein kinase [Streptomyces globosus]
MAAETEPGAVAGRRAGTAAAAAAHTYEDGHAASPGRALAAAAVGVSPYAELVFDAQGDPDPGGLRAAAGIDATDLLVFAHGWNSDRSTSVRLFERFYAPFPGLVRPGVRLGYAGVVWPSIRFPDEPIPDFESLIAPDAPGPGPAAGSALDFAARRALAGFWPGHGAQLDRVAELLAARPESEEALAEFGLLVRQLAGVAGTGAGDAPDRGVPAIFAGDVREVCRALADGLAEAAAGPPAPGLSAAGDRRALWDGAKELLRQATYYEMKKRAGAVGERGLGPALTELAARRPGLRIHLIGHSFGARVAAFSLRAVPAGARHVKSLTLLQGAFSHYAFADRLPHDTRRGGALRGLQRRVDGPVVACHSKHDAALRVFYPLASRMAGDSAGLLGFDARWGAIGHGGVQAVPGAVRLTLAAALRSGVPASGCVSVDAASVVRRGGPPAGAHSDVCHAELARVVVAAGRMGR